MSNLTINKNIRALIVPIMCAIAGTISGCASNLTGYYSKLRTKIDSGNYESAAKFVDKSQGKYGSKNILMYYLDSGIVNHFAEEYEISSKRFELAKGKFREYQQKSVTVGVSSMLVNDKIMLYYGKDFERVHISVFEALDYALSGRGDESVVEARQLDSLFKNFAVDSNYKNFYKGDGFVRYFAGLIYENAGYLNDAYISYSKALKAYKNGVAGIAVPEDLIDDAYTSALLLGMPDKASEIKKDFHQAKKCTIPENYGECIVFNYNGFIPQKTETALEFVLGDIWIYVNAANLDSKDMADFDKAKSIGVSAFAKDYIKVAFPRYKDFDNKIVSFRVKSESREEKGVLAQDLGKIAKACLKDETTKVYAKTLARAAIKYVIGKSVSKELGKQSGDVAEQLSQGLFNIFSAATSSVDRRAWNTLPDTILMSRFYLTEGAHMLKVDFLDAKGKVVDSKDIEVDIKAGKKNFAFVRSSNIRWEK
ncbi:MAG: hypothetical protein LBK92_02685 [Endomicrobium sp.]|jgi:hypothetical protein|nr:hypothetical protein [Endomicrobium sp.]